MVSVSSYPNITDITLDNLSRIIITPSFRWIVYILALALVLYSYVLEPIRFADKKTWFGLSYKYENFIMMCITSFFYIFVFLGLWLTIPFTELLTEYWYIPVIVFIFAIILHLTISSPTINLAGSEKETKSKESLSPPPSRHPSKTTSTGRTVRPSRTGTSGRS
jgi:magnesium-transporting ATPase (P-type)